MKKIILALFLLAAIASHGQSNQPKAVDTPAAMMVSASKTGWGPWFGSNDWAVSLIEWSDHPVKNVYDSGELEIRGYTLKIIRMLAKKYDSLLRRLSHMQARADQIVSTAANAIIYRPELKFTAGKIVDESLGKKEKLLDDYIAAVRAYINFTHPKVKKKGGKKS